MKVLGIRAVEMARKIRDRQARRLAGKTPDEEFLGEVFALGEALFSGILERRDRSWRPLERCQGVPD